MKRERPITGTHLFQRERCARWVWLDFHGDPKLKLAPSADAAARMAHGRRHESEWIRSVSAVEPQYPATDFEAGDRATRALMAEGAPLIYQGVFASKGRVGKPDLLRRIDGGAKPIYQIGDIKASSEAKVEHAMQLAFYADLLEHAQGERVARAFLILGNGEEAAVELADVEPLYRDAIDEVEAMRRREREPRPAYGRHCDGCHWRGVCVTEMSERGDLTLVHGVSPLRRAALEAASVSSVAELANADAGSLAEKTELPRETLRRLALQARALLDGAPHRLAPLPWKPARIALSAGIARDPIRGHYGEFLAYRTTAQDAGVAEQWLHASAAEPAGEGEAYRRFLSLLAEDRDAPIYHFGKELPDALAQLDARHGKLNDPLPGVFARLQDVQAGIRTALVLPVRRYDLESTAGALGVAAPPSAPAGEKDDAAAASRRKLAEQMMLVRRVRVGAAKAWKADAETASTPTAAGSAGAP